MHASKIWSAVSGLVGALGFAVAASSAHALPTVTFNTNVFGTQCGTSNVNKQSGVLDLVSTAACAGEGAGFLYKSNVGGSDSGAFAASYETEYFNTPNDPSEGTISLVQDPSIDCEDFGCWLTVKDGKQEPAIYAFNISGWDGRSDIDLDGFWDGKGAISNVMIWTGEGGGGDDDVPEPATIALVGLALAGLGLSRRRVARRSV